MMQSNSPFIPGSQPITQTNISDVTRLGKTSEMRKLVMLVMLKLP